MNASRPLPIAPRPFPDEAPESWVGRIAARYDLTAGELVRALRRRRAPDAAISVPGGWRTTPDLTGVLATAARLDARGVAAYCRGTGPDGAEAPRRDRPVWCAACVAEDVTRWGESYGRRAWDVAWCIACPTHRALLAEICPRCGSGGCAFRAVGGRQRLVCRLCAVPIEAVTHAEAAAEEGVEEAILQLQADLLHATAGGAPTIRRGLGLDGPGFLHAIGTLVLVTLRPSEALDRRAGAPMLDDRWTLARLPVPALHVALAIVASIRDDLIAGTAGSGQGGEVVPEALVALLALAPGQDLPRLRREALTWGPLLGRAVLAGVEAEEETRRRARAEAERFWRDAARTRRALTWGRGGRPGWTGGSGRSPSHDPGPVSHDPGKPSHHFQAGRRSRGGP